MIYVFLANGFEEVEALIPVDVLRRVGKDVLTVSINETKEVTAAHGVTVIADTLFGDNDYSDAELLFLPGGLPGSQYLAEHEGLCQELVERNKKGGLIAAICAAPALVLGTLGILNGKNATCYPGCEEQMAGANYTGELVTVDGNIVTGEGPAAAFPFAYTLAGMLAGEEAAEAVAEGMRFKHLMEK